MSKEKQSDNSNNFMSKFEKDFGDICVLGTKLLDDEPKIVSVSPAIDIGIKGIPEGTWTLLSGPEKCGKSTLALQIAANAQAQYNKEVYYISAEGRFTKLNLQSVQTLQLDRFHRIQSTQEKILSAEDLLNITIDIVKNKPGCVIIIDSVSSLCADKELGEDLTSSTRAATPKLLASFCRRIGTVIPVQKTIMICILHLQANMSGYGSPWNEDGGKFLQYQADIKLRAKGIEKIKNTDGKQIGQIVKWSVLSSALGPPGAEIESFIRYGLGIDSVMESITLAKDLGIIEQKGAWYNCTLFNEKWQGEEKVYNWFIEHPDQLKLLLEAIKKSL